MIGSTLLYYEILQKIGSGGLSEVHRADTKPDREVDEFRQCITCQQWKDCMMSGISN